MNKLPLIIAGGVIAVVTNPLHSLSSNNGWLEILGSGSQTFGASGSTNRFLWDGNKGHFQAGQYMPDPAGASVGLHSFGFGCDVYPRGEYSLVFGLEAESHSSANFSFAFGLAAFANAPYSMAFGDCIYATGNHSLAFGNSFTQASGNYSFAFGGPFTNSYGIGAFAIGREVFTYENYGYSFGDTIFNDSPGAIAMGKDIVIEGVGAIAMGQSNTALGDYSVLLGRNLISAGQYTASLGYMNEVSGLGSVAMGSNNEILSFSNRTTFAFGRFLKIRPTIEDVLVTGRWNLRASGETGDSGVNYLFVVGNGEGPSLRSDAFAVDNQGNVWAAGSINSSSQSNSFMGNVGVGTSSPAYKLEIVGGNSGTSNTLLQIRSNGTGTNTASTLRFANSTNETTEVGAGEISVLRTHVLGTTHMIFRVSTGSGPNSMLDAMRLDNQGYLHAKVPAKGGISMGNFQ